MKLQEKYHQEIKNKLQQEFKIKNPMLVPKLLKIIINTGLGEALVDHKILDKVALNLAAITGQKPKVTTAKRAISTFKLRAGDKIGLKVTLRGKRMYDFMQKLTSVVLPRLRDFRGLSRKSFDGMGNFNVGLAELTMFPEVDYSQVDKSRGVEITFVTNVKEDKLSMRLLELLGLPFEKTK
jgi:large subunit ribosomal protein L5